MPIPEIPRLTLRIGSAHAELAADLLAIDSRERGERLRTLALLGLALLRGTAAVGPAAPALPLLAPAPSSVDPHAAQRERLLSLARDNTPL